VFFPVKRAPVVEQQEVRLNCHARAQPFEEPPRFAPPVSRATTS
jgi:hypothetical protein